MLNSSDNYNVTLSLQSEVTTPNDPVPPDVEQFIDDLPPFEDMSIEQFALLCFVIIDTFSIISKDSGVGTVSVLIDNNSIMQDVVNISHLLLTPDTHCMPGR